LLKKAVRQSGYLGGFVAGLFTNDYGLIADSLKDEIVEPARSMLIPLFDEVKQTALENGALGCGISGSGPSIFTLNRGEQTARRVAEAIRSVYQKSQIPFDIHLSKVNPQGIKVD
jgi:homoserine kinase